MKFLAKLNILFILLFCCQASKAQLKLDIFSGGKLKPLQANMDIRHYTLNLNIAIDQQAISGFAEITVDLIQPADTLLLDLIDVYKIKSIWLDKVAVTFKHQHDSVLVLKPKISTGRHIVKINYEGKPPIAINPPWDGGFTWTKDKAGNAWVAINCQLNGAKIYFPCKDHPSDEPNEGADLYITIPKGLSVAGPGLLQSVKPQKNNLSTWHWKTNYTISNYCILFNIGKYEVAERAYTTINGTKVPMQFYLLPGYMEKATKLLDMRERDTRVLEKYFGEYPWIKEKIGLAQVPNPGMEHQTMITFGGPFEFTQYPKFEFSANLFHEFAHEWFANKITNTDWAHMWIQEGITTYADALFFRDWLGEKGYDSVMLSKRRGIANKKPIVLGDGLNMKEVYNGDVYNKGAFFMHTLRYVLGDSLFFPALKQLSTDVVYPYNRFLNSNDVEKHFSRYAKRDLKPLFDFYLYKAETIDIELTKVKPDTYLIRLQNMPMKLTFEVLTDIGIQKIDFVNTKRGEELQIKSKIQPVIDPNGWYFKKVIIQ
ncbi:M1 family metallopeptidase [Pedobacter sp. Du54]|uniref:M1 family metallopeptidase n=1 Tax=Pedobacter anseongensis TaxID=3133439 RepID=UPI0030B3BF10